MYNRQPQNLDDQDTPPHSNKGVAAIRHYLAHLNATSLKATPGVYRMIGEDEEVLYVGKAKDLKKRVRQYIQLHRNPIRIQRMISQTRAMEFITTHTEVEALLLEANLIKKLEPRYNVLLRDDKTFPEILIRTAHPYAQIVKHRGTHTENGSYFGPFASTGAVNRTLMALQRAFMLRPCSDNIFASRTRPCLQYQIKRCSAPCVGRISAQSYADNVTAAHAFLSGQSSHIRAKLTQEMQLASNNLDFEKAAELRDRIKALTHIQSHQVINFNQEKDMDVIGLWRENGRSCLQVFFFRNGRNNGNQAFFPQHDSAETASDILSAFLGQFYYRHTPPPIILTNLVPSEQALLEQALSLKQEKRVHIQTPQRGDKRKMTGHAEQNARDALKRKLAARGTQHALLKALRKLLGLSTPIHRIEAYDNSHIQGTAAVGAMIVADADGFNKQAYRKFNIKATVSSSGQGGNDVGMMREVLTRRFQRALQSDPDRQGAQWPDVVIVDGGKGQLNVARKVFEDLGLQDIALMGIAKGVERNAGREKIYLPERPAFMLEPDTPILNFLQRLRDESHRYAIGSHRQKRRKEFFANPLDNIAGIGAKRKKALMLHFGSAKAVAQAGLADLQAVEGISQTVAQKIYSYFH